MIPFTFIVLSSEDHKLPFV